MAQRSASWLGMAVWAAVALPVLAGPAPDAPGEPLAARALRLAARLEGVISAVDTKQQTLRVSQGDKRYLVRTTEKTAITLDGRKAGLDRLKAGHKVVVEFVVGADGEATDTAASITATTAR